MTWADLTRKPTAKALRQFAAGWLVVFGAFGARQYFHLGHHYAGLVLGALAVTVGLLGLLRPGAVKWIFLGWMGLAFPIGWTISQLMLLVMFYGIMTPVALMFRIGGRDVLRRKRTSNQATFWLPKPAPRDVRSYFRQY